MNNSIAIILAAGDGKRMKSKTPKMLHEVCGKSIVSISAQTAAKATGRKPIVVYGSGNDAVPQNLEDSCIYSLQSERLGSGHAVMMAANMLEASECEYCVIMAGDMPLIKQSTITDILNLTTNCEYSALILSTIMDNPHGFGRIIRDDLGSVIGIVEEKDASDKQKSIKEVNSSIYCFKSKDLLDALTKLKPDNAQKEYYLTDCIKIMHDKGLLVGAYCIDDFEQCLGINDRVQLAQANKVMRKRINNEIMMSGVTMIDPDNTYVDLGVEIGKDTVIYPGVVLKKDTKIGENCILYQGSRIENSIIGNGTIVENSVVIDSVIGDDTKIGPFAYIRPGTNIGDKCRIGDFVEVKNSNIQDGSKVSHLTYVGDSDIGKEVNVGCGVVFVNYDGKNKYRSTVEDRAFIGCNTNIISPINVGEGSYIAAGATVTKDIPKDALCIARAREVIKEGFAKGRFPKK